MGLLPPARPEQVVFAFDHYGASSGEAAQRIQQRARDYGRAHQLRCFEVGQGIGHQLVLEQGLVRPGTVAVGADSHAVSYGAVGAFGTGIGSSDLAGILACGQLWLRVPATLRVELQGQLQPGVSAKDLILMLAGRHGADGAAGLAIEYTGPGVVALDMDDRIVLANMAVELGAKAGIFGVDAITSQWLAGRQPAPLARDVALTWSDPGAEVVDTWRVQLDQVVPQVALPHRVDRVQTLASLAPIPIDTVYIGTCTGGRAKDYREALAVLQTGERLAKGVRLVVTPASAAIAQTLEAEGVLDGFRAFGADIQPAGCGACCGTCGSRPADGERVVSTANRNFKGRMGNGQAEIYLTSTRSSARAALTGVLGDAT